MATLELKCDCGKVMLRARDVSPTLGNRLICYCKDCQQFPIKLNKASVLDEFGGTDIYQMPPAHLEITSGKEHIACMKHTEKGLLRFYAACCDSPIANAPGPGMPFVGLIHSTDTQPSKRDEHLGRVKTHAFTESATQPLPPERTGGLTRLIVRFLGQMLLWRINGKTKPHPFFDEQGQAITKVEVR